MCSADVKPLLGSESCRSAMLQVLEDCNLWKDFPKGLHVLVVDKDPATLNDIKAKLEACRYRVTTFERSEDAVTALTNPDSSFHVALIESCSRRPSAKDWMNSTFLVARFARISLQ